jgi:hypothetical protein
VGGVVVVDVPKWATETVKTTRKHLRSLPIRLIVNMETSQNFVTDFLDRTGERYGSLLTLDSMSLGSGFGRLPRTAAKGAPSVPSVLTSVTSQAYHYVCIWGSDPWFTITVLTGMAAPYTL